DPGNSLIVSVRLQFVLSNSQVFMINLNIVIDRISCAVFRKGWHFIVLLFLVIACRKGDGFEQEQLSGKWDITKAERNGRETSYLRRGYFIIDHSMLTINITGEDEKGTYSMKDNKLVMGEKNFELIMLRNDSMIVKYRVGPHSEFLFHMVKSKENVQ
ncbi:MAG: hypothetical protein ABJC12_03165, partial [Saprospiraceae bacterium]